MSWQGYFGGWLFGVKESVYMVHFATAFTAKKENEMPQKRKVNHHKKGK